MGEEPRGNGRHVSSRTALDRLQAIQMDLVIGKVADDVAEDLLPVDVDVVEVNARNELSGVVDAQLERPARVELRVQG